MPKQFFYGMQWWTTRGAISPSTGDRAVTYFGFESRRSRDRWVSRQANRDPIAPSDIELRRVLYHARREAEREAHPFSPYTSSLIHTDQDR